MKRRKRWGWFFIISGVGSLLTSLHFWNDAHFSTTRLNEAMLFFGVGGLLLHGVKESE